MCSVPEPRAGLAPKGPWAAALAPGGTGSQGTGSGAAGMGLSGSGESLERGARLGSGTRGLTQDFLLDQLPGGTRTVPTWCPPGAPPETSRSQAGEGAGRPPPSSPALAFPPSWGPQPHPFWPPSPRKPGPGPLAQPCPLTRPGPGVASDPGASGNVSCGGEGGGAGPGAGEARGSSDKPAPAPAAAGRSEQGRGLPSALGPGQGGFGRYLRMCVLPELAAAGAGRAGMWRASTRPSWLPGRWPAGPGGTGRGRPAAPWVPGSGSRAAPSPRGQLVPPCPGGGGEQGRGVVRVRGSARLPSGTVWL